MVVLNSALSHDLDTPPPSPTTPKPPLRQTFHIDHDYELFHIVLFYLYTGRIQFSTTPSSSLDPDLPYTCNAEGIYATSHHLQLSSLDKKAFHFLKATCTVDNITRKVFSKFAEKHAEVGTMYDEFFLENWGLVKVCGGFERFFEEIEEGDFEEYVRINRKFREMVRRCT